MTWKLSNQELDRLRAAKDWAIDRFFQKANGRGIVGIGIGLKARNDRETSFPCLRIYVNNKPDLSELVPAVFPSEILGVLTDVIDIGRPFTVSNRLVTEPAGVGPEYGPGSSIGPRLNGDPNIGRAISGTLGSVVYGKPEGSDSVKRYIIGCNHVLSAKGRIPPNTPIVSPAPADGAAGQEIATSIAAVRIERNQSDLRSERNIVDCAVAEVKPAIPIRRGFLIGPGGEGVDVDNFWDQEKAGPPPLGATVAKFGKASGRTEGTIVDIDADILVDYSFGTFRFVHQVLIKGRDRKDFATDGDSGAVAVITGGAEGHPTPAAVALVIAPLGKYTAGCPMDEVLAALKKELGFPLQLAPPVLAARSPGN